MNFISYSKRRSDDGRPPIIAFHIDSPNAKHVDSQMAHLEGWVIPRGSPDNLALRVNNNGVFYDVKYGKKRPDLLRAFPDIPATKVLNAGFELDFNFEDGYLILEINTGAGYVELFKTEIEYSPEQLVDMLRNPLMVDLVAEHENLIANKRVYHYEKNNLSLYRRHKDDPKLIAWYLPQFHPIEENDRTWGKGFTEWTNVVNAKPRFVGHQQPILPGDLGFYDLRVEDTIYEQISLAKQHGLYAFCFYYYWFSGHKIMDTPINALLRHKEWDFNFAICWANENWTKRWDGRDDEIIVGQKYLEDDPINFIKDVEDILLDDRYVTIDGKPMLIVYRASELKNPTRFAKVWREYFRSQHGRELYLVSSMGFDTTDPRKFGFDAGIDFAPQSTFFKEEKFPDGEMPYITQRQKFMDRRFSGSVVSYRDYAINEGIVGGYDFPTLYSIPTSWDNDARRKGGGFVMHGSNADIFGNWLDRAIRWHSENRESLGLPIFINAWNEWAEGAILEPSQHSGHANLNRLTEVLSLYSKNSHNKKEFPLYGDWATRNIKENAVFLHIEHNIPSVKLAEAISRYNNADVYVTAIEKYKKSVNELKLKIPNMISHIVPKRGGDLLPFAMSVRRSCLNRYSKVYKITSADIDNITTRVVDEEVMLTREECTGCVTFNSPKTQLKKIQWLDVEDFPPSL